jgi:hypothetical protein
LFFYFYCSWGICQRFISNLSHLVRTHYLGFPPWLCSVGCAPARPRFWMAILRTRRKLARAPIVGFQGVAATFQHNKKGLVQQL